MMLGRDLINYIYTNGLSDKPIYENGRLLGFITDEEAATRFNVGVATVRVWVNQGKLEGLRINDTVFVPADVVDPRTVEVGTNGIVAGLQKGVQNGGK